MVVPAGLWGAEACQVVGEGDFDAAGDDCGFSVDLAVQDAYQTFMTVCKLTLEKETAK